MDLATTYLNSVDRLISLAGDLSDDDCATVVPASPAWTVRDTYAHLAGAATDMVAGNTAGAGSDQWTATQVEARARHSLPDIVAEWRAVAPVFAEMIGTHSEQLWRFVSGTWLHEQDIRAAVGLRGLRNTDGGEVALGLVDAIGARIEAAGLPALRIEVAAAIDSHRTWLLGPGAAAATLRPPDRYELARMAGGRRSLEQMRSWEWEGDAEPYLPLLATYGPTDVDLTD